MYVCMYIYIYEYKYIYIYTHRIKLLGFWKGKRTYENIICKFIKNSFNCLNARICTKLYNQPYMAVMLMY